MGFKENLETLKSAEDIEKITLYEDDLQIGEIPNVEGKKGSLKVYANIFDFKNGEIGKNKIEQGLILFAEHTKDAKDNPGKHPSIDILLNAEKNNKKIRAVIDFKP